MDQETTSNYGKKEIDVISEFFGKIKMDPSTKKPYATIIEKECLIIEWEIFKQYALTNFKSSNQKNFGIIFILTYKKTFQT